MNIPNSSTAPAAGEYAGDEVSAIVLDPGYSTVRAGFAGEDVPKSVCPSFYGLTDEGKYLFGENAIHAPVGNVNIKNYWGSDGIVEDWDTATKLWEYAITSRLTGARPGDPAKNGLNDGADANGDAMDMDIDAIENNEKPLEDSPLLVTEPGWNSAKAREKYIEIAMEDWGTPAFFLQKTGVLAAFASGKASGIIIDVGASHTSVTPVLDGMVLRKGVQKSPLAGNFVSSQIRQTFKQATPEIPLTPHYLVQSKTQVDAGAPAQATYKSFSSNPPTDSFRLNEEDRILTEFKESVVEVWPGPGRFTNGTNEELAKNMPGRPFEMPDGWNQVFGPERFRAAEGLFDASAALTSETNPRPKDEQTIPRLVQAAVQQVDADQRPMLLSNIVVTGGSTLLYKFNERLNYEINNIYPSTRNKLIAPGSVVERKYAAWIGGSILASLGSFHQLWISKKEYEEHGAGIVEKRCR
ncbi:actin-like protein-like protein 6A [Cucurbitaria berberidis CBS 394.84]|uniref:Actin-like protein-like protein 6A n=1 Tax=Cucurbitaria berberidis CBS 394.84 TaxID=1168544 RepID=A0A9P4L702_9PLEO|nr:actin-like protein-like protein 6A [Cucurbitaria berberidis CBS 394.84]KAF1843623.1 actin-like protein-like protein 6A [Cucurbitaria berberidis CBS 394.84]